MTDRERLIREVEELPEPLVSEILEIVRAARARRGGPGTETALASEHVLGRDWLRPEEEEAWKDLCPSEPAMPSDSDEYTGFPTAKDTILGDTLGAACTFASKEYRREHDWYHYITGYKDAADILLAHLEETGRYAWKLGLPIVFLYRHHLELAIKQLARDCRRLLGRDVVVPNIHPLDKLWQQLCLPLLKKVWLGGTDSDEMQQTTRLLDEFCRIDSTSLTFRYPEDKEGTPYLSGLGVVDLDGVRQVREVVGKISLLLECISTDLYAREFYSF